ncbi:hypothetical protein LOTGIDRAFT_209094 [Lottia gigantea]|uniref:3-oxoacyl-[acyl-carrier-protein] reductase n=1 Tax=Lottia gigantea TaxID=225164 RepID=V4ASS3_LOTGI|nr:hypothetical protein LOTGIDRAFT_209094 [Lottia gigantea]ESO97895.1 hypothetical protein LOTGIDRAFT_209094 [Lottia gigantea]
MACAFSFSKRILLRRCSYSVLYQNWHGLHGKVALVTGSTSGIGRGIAEGLASRGCNIILNGFGAPNEIKDLEADIIKKYDTKVHHFQGDLSRSNDVQRLIDDAFKIYPGGVDILINNAGLQYVSPVESFPAEKWNLLLSIMLTAPFLLTQRCIPTMKSKGWGRIINISSAHGLVASPYKAAYVSAKHGIMGLTKVVALEMAGSGITCNTVCPGYVETPLFINQAKDKAVEKGISVDDAKKDIVKVHPSGEPVKVEEISETVCFLCSSSANQITGTNITMDGGWTAN